MPTMTRSSGLRKSSWWNCTRMRRYVSPREVDEQFAAQHPELRPGRHVRVIVRDTGHGMTSNVSATWLTSHTPYLLQIATAHKHKYGHDDEQNRTADYHFKWDRHLISPGRCIARASISGTQPTTRHTSRARTLIASICRQSVVSCSFPLTVNAFQRIRTIGIRDYKGPVTVGRVHTSMRTI